MFDPTAFDNMKVVLEGALYDLDLSGEICITDRNDLLNMAKLSRSYEITFIQGRDASIHCTLLLEAELKNLAAELLTSTLDNTLAGAQLSVIFIVQHEKQRDLYMKFEEEIRNIWGVGRSIKQEVSYLPLESTDKVTSKITIQFNRLILEDQIDDLTAMLDYCLATLEKLTEISL